MNILPKKRWHVRTKENIARVRKDEAEAAEKAKQEHLRIENADREARINVLKQKSKERLEKSSLIESSRSQSPKTYNSEGHINFFADLEHTTKASNKDHDKEVKEKKEQYEKQIGYLTYLGQDTNEALGKKNWYEVLPESSRFNRSNEIKETYDKLVLKDKEGIPKFRETDEKNGEVSWKAKQLLDPINSFRKYCGDEHLTSTKNNTKIVEQKSYKQESILPMRHKVKTDKKTRKEEKLKGIQKLREARLKREQQEKIKTNLFLSNLGGSTVEQVEPKVSVQRVKPKYNSQFNPELARQNYK